MVAKKAKKKTGKKVKDLPVKAKAKNVKGGTFAKFGDIKGESTDKDHKDWVMI